MAIPVYRQNADYDDWEIASVYASDDCDSLGRSASYESSRRSNSRDDAVFRSQGPLYGDTRARADYPTPHAPSQQHRNYPIVAVARSQRDVCHVSGKRNNFVLPPAPIVPPPGVIFPAKDWVLPPQDMYSPPVVDHMTPPSDMPVDMALMDASPPPPLLLSPSSPPHGLSPLIMRPTPLKAIGHGQAPHTTPATGLNANNSHAPPVAPPPPRYHELMPTMLPRLADAGSQAHPGKGMNPRRPGHDVLSPCGPEGTIARGPLASEEMRVEEGQYGGGGQPIYGPSGERAEVHSPAGLGKYEYEHARGYDAGRMATTRLARRERRPSIWERFVRRFSPSRGVSARHT